jgi:hypothetical protein
MIISEIVDGSSVEIGRIKHANLINAFGRLLAKELGAMTS